MITIESPSRLMDRVTFRNMVLLALMEWLTGDDAQTVIEKYEQAILTAPLDPEATPESVMHDILDKEGIR